MNRTQPSRVTNGDVSEDEACAVLGLGRSRVRQLARGPHLASRRLGGTLYIERSSLQQLVEERDRWITVKQAAALLGCTTSRVHRAVRDGTLKRRPGSARALPSIPRAELQELAMALKSERNAQEERRRQRAEATGRLRNTPPDEEHEWWTTTHTASALGVSPNRVRQLVNRGTIPVTIQHGRYWFRSDHVLQLVSARAFRAAQRRHAAGRS